MRYLIFLILISLIFGCAPKPQLTTFKCTTPDVPKPEYEKFNKTDSRELLQILINNYGKCLEYSKQLEAANEVCK